MVLEDMRRTIEHRWFHGIISRRTSESRLLVPNRQVCAQAVAVQCAVSFVLRARCAQITHIVHVRCVHGGFYCCVIGGDVFGARKCFPAHGRIRDLLCGRGQS